MPIIGVTASSILNSLNATAFDSIATVTGNGSSATMTFSSIPSTYKHLQIRFYLSSTGPTGAANYGGWTTFNGDTNANYSNHGVYGDGSSAAAYAATSATNAGGISYVTSASNVQSAGIMDILDYTDANKYKTIRTLVGGDFNGGGSILLNSGSWRSTSAITSITLSLNTGFGAFAFTTTSKACLYGIK